MYQNHCRFNWDALLLILICVGKTFKSFSRKIPRRLGRFLQNWQQLSGSFFTSVTMFLAIIVLAGFACQFLPGTTACSNSINTPRAKGEAVVRDVVAKINGLGIFPNDHRFLCRIAWVESRYGSARGTYRRRYYGGIWQVKYRLPLCNKEVLMWEVLAIVT